MRLDVGFLLHAYQPWWNLEFFPKVIKRLNNNTYRPNFRKLVNDDRYRLTLNLNYSLVEIFQQLNDRELLDMTGELVENDRVEVTATAAYHPYMPLITTGQAQEQIICQEQNMKNLFPGYMPRGFYLPEMGYRPGLEELLVQNGYEWTITDDPPYIAHHSHEQGYHIQPPYDWIPSVNGVAIFLRSKLWSYHKIADAYTHGKDLANQLALSMRNWTQGKNSYMIIAMDFETFEEWHPGYWDHFFPPFLDAISAKAGDVDISLKTLSEIFDIYPKKPSFVPAGSWATGEQDYLNGNLHRLWNNPMIKSHRLIWDLYSKVQFLINGDSDARLALMKGVNSCTWWQIPLGNPHLARPGIDKMVQAAEIAGLCSPDIYSLRDTIYHELNY